MSDKRIADQPRVHFPAPAEEAPVGSAFDRFVESADKPGVSEFSVNSKHEMVPTTPKGFLGRVAAFFGLTTGHATPAENKEIRNQFAGAMDVAIDDLITKGKLSKEVGDELSMRLQHEIRADGSTEPLTADEVKRVQGAIDATITADALCKNLPKDKEGENRFAKIGAKDLAEAMHSLSSGADSGMKLLIEKFHQPINGGDVETEFLKEDLTLADFVSQALEAHKGDKAYMEGYREELTRLQSNEGIKPSAVSPHAKKEATRDLEKMIRSGKPLDTIAVQRCINNGADPRMRVEVKGKDGRSATVSLASLAAHQDKLTLMRFLISKGVTMGFVEPGFGTYFGEAKKAAKGKKADSPEAKALQVMTVQSAQSKSVDASTEVEKIEGIKARQSAPKDFLNGIAKMDVGQVERALKNGADVNARDDKGRLALTNAVIAGNSTMVNVLVNAGATVSGSLDGKTVDDGFQAAVIDLLRPVNEGSLDRSNPENKDIARNIDTIMGFITGQAESEGIQLEYVDSSKMTKKEGIKLT